MVPPWWWRFRHGHEPASPRRPEGGTRAARRAGVGQEAYPDLFGKAAALLRSPAVNRPFVDGNKRTAWVSCVVFPAMNGVQLRPDIDAAERLVIAVSTGAWEEVEVIGEALRELAEQDV
ncbi:phage killer protein [Streptomyces sp. F-3]|nr:phage killer protein [Streptomyces sp. F-3]